MDYQQFVNEVTLEVQKKAAPGMKVMPYEALKNNGIKRQEISLKSPTNNMTPSIFLEDYYESFKSGKSLARIADEILESSQHIPDFAINAYSSFSDFGAIKKRIVYKLINYDSNTYLLNDIPNIPYLDLAIVFYVLLDHTSSGTATMLIHNKELALWNTTIDEIFSCAKVNTPQILPSTFSTMASAIMDALELPEVDESSIPSSEMFVLRNTSGSFGASCLLYEGQLKQIGKKLENNFYVLPSSIHELIIIPDSSQIDTTFLHGMIAEINRTEVAPDEVLSDYPYYYDRGLETLNLA